jgi:glycosyltransferase involved in cell wall biosynthesis
MRVSIIIKSFNEERNIARTIESCLAALHDLEGEVILADSLSTDRTIEIASAYPITIVQIDDATTRGCGTAPQLGYQYSSGDFVFLIDGDMVLYRNFLLEALNCLKLDEGLAGVGGIVRDVNLDNLEFASRAARSARGPQLGYVDRLNGGGLYRRSAIESVGYLSDQNLHAFEEFELGARLRAQGWRLKRIDGVAVDHFGYDLGAYRLLWNRIRTGYAFGAGEVARATVGKPYFYETLQKIRTLWLSALVMAWVLITLLAISIMQNAVQSVIAAIVLLLIPIAVMSAKRRSIELGTYAVVVWIVMMVCSIKGFLRRRRNPHIWISSNVLQMNTFDAGERPDLSNRRMR